MGWCWERLSRTVSQEEMGRTGQRRGRLVGRWAREKVMDLQRWREML